MIEPPGRIRTKRVPTRVATIAHALISEGVEDRRSGTGAEVELRDRWFGRSGRRAASALTAVTMYVSNRSAAIPAQSPTLSPTLSAMTAGFRGSSSGIPASTLPTRSAPDVRALGVDAAADPGEEAHQGGAEQEADHREDVARRKRRRSRPARGGRDRRPRGPSRCRPGRRSASSPPGCPLRAWAAVRTFARTLTNMPTAPASALPAAPNRNPMASRGPLRCYPEGEGDDDREHDRDDEDGRVLSAEEGAPRPPDRCERWSASSRRPRPRGAGGRSARPA